MVAEKDSFCDYFPPPLKFKCFKCVVPQNLSWIFKIQEEHSRTCLFTSTKVSIICSGHNNQHKTHANLWRTPIDCQRLSWITKHMYRLGMPCPGWSTTLDIHGFKHLLDFSINFQEIQTTLHEDMNLRRGWCYAKFFELQFLGLIFYFYSFIQAGHMMCLTHIPLVNLWLVMSQYLGASSCSGISWCLDAINHSLSFYILWLILCIFDSYRHL